MRSLIRYVALLMVAFFGAIACEPVTQVNTAPPSGIASAVYQEGAGVTVATRSGKRHTFSIGEVCGKTWMMVSDERYTLSTTGIPTVGGVVIENLRCPPIRTNRSGGNNSNILEDTRPPGTIVGDNPGTYNPRGDGDQRVGVDRGGNPTPAPAPRVVRDERVAPPTVVRDTTPTNPAPPPPRVNNPPPRGDRGVSDSGGTAPTPDGS